MKIAIGADHHGVQHKEFLMRQAMITGIPVQWIDVGCNQDHDCDYPIYAHKVVELLKLHQVDLGILLCGTGAGIAMAANRFKGIYAAVAWNVEVARLHREHDDVNILVLPADYVTQEYALEMVEEWFSASFEGGRHQERLEMVDQFGG